MKTDRKILVCEKGKLILKKISLVYKDDNGGTAYLLDPEKQSKDKAESLYERIEKNFLLIGLLKQVDMSNLSNDEMHSLMIRKHEKEDRFLCAAREKGYSLGVDMDPDDILRFYISLSSQERIALECKP